MSDVVVTCPMKLWDTWLGEGHLPGAPWDGETEYHFFGSGARPKIAPGERVYVVAHGKLRGYAPLVAIDVRCDRPDAAVVRLGYPSTGVAPERTAFIRVLHEWPPPLPEWWWPHAQWGLVRHTGAVSCTIPTPIRGFQGWRYRWWQTGEEQPFPNWMEP